MGEQVRVVPPELRDFALYLQNSVVDDFGAISVYVTGQACDTSGFTGLLSILQSAVTGVGDRFSDVLDVGRDRLAGVAEGLHKVAQNYEKTDTDHAVKANNLANQIPAGG